MIHSSTPGGHGGYATARRVFGAVARWARHAPTATAVSAPDGTFRFSEVAEYTDALAAGLVAAGVGPQTPVGLCLGRSRWVVPSLLAIWKVGATAVPVDDRHPADRLNFVLRDADVRILLGTGLPPGVAPPRSRTLDPAVLAGTGRPAWTAESHPDHCAYIIYTSGTTGWPKGVEVTYRGLDTHLDALADLDLPSGGLGVNAVSPAFDGWLWCTLLYLLHGQGVAIVDLADGVDAAIAGVRPRTVCLTPSLLAACADDLPTAQVIVVAGEPCPPALARRFAGGGRRVLNVYGPTEMTIAATWADSRAGDDVTTIGRPIRGYRAYVLDDDRRPVSPGTLGELYLAGPGIARGYRNRPGLTASRFVADDFTGDGSRMYRTGDMVVQRADGQLEYAGRRDDQVKIRGFRVELGEIERVATRVEGVHAAAAFVTVSGDAAGLAVVPAAEGTDPDELAGRVLAHCADSLPSSMVPVVVDVLPALPVATTGKVDRTALALTSSPASPTGRPPAGERERQVCAVLGELLGRPLDDVDADFFELGGHSLLAARAVSALRRLTGLRLTMRHLLAQPTAAGVAAELDRIAAVSGVSDLVLADTRVGT
ncbi:non-ribosomal peptide synthetase [Rhizohabitans arisaemae]|uniref:non-ribosomal peptide synthetase n=1 Tax=Rhizohabitans arisaemae TaxID=2720610 RepID=UPI0024B083FA|nr:non-ribosomal peptide synthetase [Rhizohabitans arisaemae]